MQLKTKDDFLKWAEPYGIGLHPLYTSLLSYKDHGDDTRFWALPYDTGQKIALIVASLELVDPWKTAWVYKREDPWESGDYVVNYDPEMSRRPIIMSIGIPNGFDSVVLFEEDDRAKLLLLLVTQSAFMSNCTDDLFIVFDHGRHFLWLDHEGAVFVIFADPTQVAKFVEKMKAGGFELPTDPPSGFSWQPWMDRD